MAKLNRERKMFFGSWTGNAITEAATADIGDSAGITGATVTAATFGTKVNGLSGEYTLSLNLPDPAEKLRNNPMFSIRLANKNVWDESTGYNKLYTITL